MYILLQENNSGTFIRVHATRSGQPNQTKKLKFLRFFRLSNGDELAIVTSLKYKFQLLN